VALSLVLVAGAGLFVRTLHNLQTLDPGFSTEGVLVAELENRRTPFPQDLLESIRQIPGVSSASVSTHTPLNGWTWSEPAVPLGQPLPERDNAFFIGTGPGYFTTMNTRLLAGRDFTDGDTAGRAPVAIVNEAYAERYFPQQNPVGQFLSADVSGTRRQMAIVGLVRNTNVAGLRNAPPPTVYVSIAQLTGSVQTSVTVRAASSIGQVSRAVRDALQARLPETIEVRHISAQVEATMVQERMMATLAAGFGALALTLACVGLYGLLAYGVAQRTREIGIRIALGAPRPSVIGHVLKGGARLVFIGIILGLPVVWAASRWIESLLFGLRATDPATIGGAILLLMMAAQLAAYLPARRASRVDPLVALRHE
jgi:predicted permease